MNSSAKLGGFAAVLAAVFGAALLVGSQVGAIGTEATSHGEQHGAEHGSGEHLPGGLMNSESGYRLDVHTTDLVAGRRSIAFTVDGPDGHPVTDYEVTHAKRLHLVAVRRDFTGFQHVHPVMDAHGTWRVPLSLDPGAWRVFTDFKPSGTDGFVLGADLAVAGTTRPTPASRPVAVSHVDRYTVRIGGRLAAGETSPLTLTITRDGRPVTDLQPYLGAYGHLVALREGDLAYLHVHPDDGAGPGPRIRFDAEVPSAGRYHLYLDFKRGGVVRTAEFTVDAR